MRTRADGKFSGLISRCRTSRYLALASVGVLLSGGCVNDGTVARRRGTPEDRAADAVGTVGVSAPLFTPIEALEQGDRKLNFGVLRSESALKAAIESPNFSAERLLYNDLLLRLHADFSGKSVSSTNESGTDERTLEQLAERDSDTSTDPTSDDTGGGGSPVAGAGPDADPPANSDLPGSGLAPNTRERGQKRRSSESYTTPTPDRTNLPGAPAGDSARTAKMAALLDKPATRTAALSPDEWAGLIASYKRQMIDLEEFHNFEGYDFARGLSHEYVPYKMHFTVTAEPGWYSRWYEYDAVAEVDIAPRAAYAPAASRPEIIVLSASPAETAQTVQEYTAALDRLQIAIAAEGTVKGVAVAGELEKIRELAERLDAIRSERTLTVGFQGTNRMRIRFLSSRVTNLDRRRDIQPLARMITATVLVRALSQDLKVTGGGISTQSVGGARLSSLTAQDAVGSASQREVAVYQERLADIARRISFQKATLVTATQRVDEQMAEAASIETVLPDTTTRLSSQTAHLMREIRSAAEAGDEALRTVLNSRVGTDESGPLVTDVESLAGEWSTSSGKHAQLANSPSALDWVDEVKQLRGRIAVTAQRFSRLNAEMTLALSDLLAGRKEFDTLIAARAAIDRELAARRIPPEGRESTCRVLSYFAPSVFDSDGQIRPPRDTPFGPTRPNDRLYGSELDLTSCGAKDWKRAEIQAWIPPWLGEMRRELQILECGGYYRVPLADLSAKAAEFDSVFRDLAAAEKALDGAKASRQSAQATLEAATASALTKRKTWAGLGKQLEVETDPKLRPDVARRLEEARIDYEVEVERLGKATVGLSEAEAGLKTAEKKREEKTAPSEAARAAMRALTASVIQSGRLAVALRVRGPANTLLADGRMQPLTATARIVGVTDCVTRRRCCISSTCAPVDLRPIGVGEWAGTIEMDDVDLSGALPNSIAATSDVSAFRIVQAWVEVVLRSGDASAVPSATGARGSSGEIPGRIEQTAVADVPLRPWTMSATPDFAPRGRR